MLFILTPEAVTTNPLFVLVVIINSYINVKTCGRMRTKDILRIKNVFPTPKLGKLAIYGWTLTTGNGQGRGIYPSAFCPF
jgi:hypothetical protein